MGTGNCIENAQRKIIGQARASIFTFHKLIFVNCGAHFICRKRCFLKRFGTNAIQMIAGKYSESVLTCERETE